MSVEKEKEEFKPGGARLGLVPIHDPDPIPRTLVGPAGYNWSTDAENERLGAGAGKSMSPLRGPTDVL